MKIRRWVKVSLFLGILSLAADGLAHLALTDIHHGEGDLSIEWRVLQFCALAILVFQASAIATLVRALRNP